MKRILMTIATTLLTVAPALAMDSLSQFEWKNRVFIVFGNADDAKLIEQVRVLKTQTRELEDWDMIVLQVSGNAVRRIHGAASDIDAAKLRAQAKASDKAFETVLVGKDGGVKFRSAQVVGNVEIFDLIDRMPMRQAGR